MSGYSVDLRERVVGAWQQGKTQSWIADTFQLSVSSVKRYISRYRELGHVQPTVQTYRQPTISRQQEAELVQQLHEHPTATLAQHVALWTASHGVKVAVSTMWESIDRVGWTYKKRRWQPKNVTQ